MENRSHVQPGSDQQIKAIVRRRNPSLYYRLCLLFVKFVRRDEYYKFFHNLFHLKSDATIFEAIKPFIKQMKEDPRYLESVAFRHAELISGFVNDVKNYLDFGCGKCDLTSYLGKQMKLTRAHTFGTDVKEEFENKWDAARKSNTEITFDYIKDSVIPFDVKFDVVTCFMVLHHIEDPIPTIQNIYDSLETDGILYIREHNCVSNDDKIFADLVHSLYMLQNGSAIEKIHAQRNHYKSAREWKAIFSDIGFKEVYYSEENMSVSNNYKAIYRKCK